MLLSNTSLQNRAKTTKKTTMLSLNSRRRKVPKYPPFKLQRRQWTFSKPTWSSLSNLDKRSTWARKIILRKENANCPWKYTSARVSSVSPSLNRRCRSFQGHPQSGYVLKSSVSPRNRGLASAEKRSIRRMRLRHSTAEFRLLSTLVNFTFLLSCKKSSTRDWGLRFKILTPSSTSIVIDIPNSEYFLRIY